MVYGWRAKFVGIAQRCRHVAGDAQSLVHRELSFACQAVAKRLALDVRHDIVGARSAGLERARVEQPKDVRMLETCGELDLPEKAFGTECGDELGPQELDGNEPAVLEVTGEVHRGHAAPPELALDQVPITEGISQRRRHDGQEGTC
jgi:hypothetical protein